MNDFKKDQIRERLEAFCTEKGSQNKAAIALNVSAATISQIRNRNWDLIKDEMWRRIENGMGTTSNEWVTVDTKVYREFTEVLTDAKEEALVMAVCSDAGSGKSETISLFQQNHKNVFVLKCGDHWTRKHYLAQLLKALGMNYTGYTRLNEMMEDAVGRILTLENPQIIMDEVDKLPDTVFNFFISLYNELEDRCSIILTSTDYLERRIKRGLNANKKGFKEIYSRIGRRFIKLSAIDEHDVLAIIAANGITQDSSIKRIKKEVKYADYDLRRLKRLIYREKKMTGNPYRGE